MSRASFVTLHLARFDKVCAPPSHEGEGEGILFSGVAADSRAAGTDPKTHEAFVFALIGLHADESSARRRFEDRRAVAPWMDDAKETWDALLRPFRHRGQVNWIDRGAPGLALDVSPVQSDRPFVAITSVGWNLGPDLDMNRVREFSEGVFAIRASISGLAGLRGAQSFFFPGVLPLDPMTITFWQSEAALRAFAYEGGSHKRQMEEQTARKTYDRSSFTRAMAIETRGSWHGADPVRP